jgi:hypothetical protein
VSNVNLEAIRSEQFFCVFSPKKRSIDGKLALKPGFLQQSVAFDRIMAMPRCGSKKPVLEAQVS